MIKLMENANEYLCDIGLSTKNGKFISKGV